TALVPPLQDNGQLVDLLAEVTGQPAASVRRRLAHEERQLGFNVAQEVRRLGIARNEWSEALVDFYRHTDSFLYESAAWDRNPRKLPIRQWIGDHLARSVPPPARLLTYGDGLGFDSAYLAQCGFDVTYFEVSELNRAFAGRLFERLGCAVQ